MLDKCQMVKIKNENETIEATNEQKILGLTSNMDTLLHTALIE